MLSRIYEYICTFFSMILGIKLNDCLDFISVEDDNFDEYHIDNSAINYDSLNYGLDKIKSLQSEKINKGKIDEILSNVEYSTNQNYNDIYRYYSGRIFNSFDKSELNILLDELHRIEKNRKNYENSKFIFEILRRVVDSEEINEETLNNVYNETLSKHPGITINDKKFKNDVLSYTSLLKRKDNFENSGSMIPFFISKNYDSWICYHGYGFTSYNNVSIDLFLSELKWCLLVRFFNFPTSFVNENNKWDILSKDFKDFLENSNKINEGLITITKKIIKFKNNNRRLFRDK